MKDLLQKAGLPEPIYCTEGMFPITLLGPSKTYEKAVEERLRAILRQELNFGLAQEKKFRKILKRFLKTIRIAQKALVPKGCN